MISAVIVAGGVSSRYGKNKLEEKIFEKNVLQHSVNAFFGIADEIIVVGAQIDGAKCVEGGATRFLSVQNGLNAVSPDCNVVAIHDAARPFVSKELITKLIHSAIANDSAVPCVDAVDTVWQTGDDAKPLDRGALKVVQTPQCFNFAMLKNAFDNASRGDYTDESSLFWATYGKIDFCAGEQTNKKITYLGDVPSYRVGVGFDVHAFEQGSFVRLGGVNIPYTKKLKGHSDADVLCHALCDAILSGSGNRDIGVQFPDTDPQYAGADSIKLLKDCVYKAKLNGFEIINVSAVIICQEPKLAPYIDEMAQTVANVLCLPADCVNLSATTTERLGALGNGDGIACQAYAILKRVESGLY